MGIRDNLPFIVMESVSGTPLREWTEKNIGDWRATTELFAKLAEGLSALHQMHVVHRDVSPKNILVRAYDQTPKLIDFGIVKNSGHEKQSLASEVNYRAPEQFTDNQHVGTGVDVFALGLLLYESLAKVPVDRSSLADGGVFDNIPPSLPALCLRAIANDPFERPDAATFAAELRRVLDTHKALIHAAPLGHGPSDSQRKSSSVQFLLVSSVLTIALPVITTACFAIQGTLLLSPPLAIGALGGLFGFRLARHLQRNPRA